MIPYADLKAQYHSIKAEIDAAIAGVLESSQFALGTEVAGFEKEFAAYCANRPAVGLETVGVNSGTSALHLALLAAGVGPGDEVVTTPFTFVATVAAIQWVGATPVYVDIDPQSYNLDPGRLESALTARTKAILPVHLYGQPVDMKPLLSIARSRGILVIEDAAQAHGAEYRGQRAGSLADLACFSYYPGKNLGAYGEAGAVVTANPEFAQTIRLLRSWGESRRYYHDLRGFNYRMEGMQGAILRVKLRHLERWTEARRTHAALYDRLLKDSGIVTPRQMPYARHVYTVYAIRTPRRDALGEALKAADIQYGIHYPVPVHLQRAYRDARYELGAFPIAERVAGEVLSLPIYPELQRAQIERISEVVRSHAAA
jgi:dTDP-4-amino-4,6-dideoxygalactose transaminase